MSVLLFFFQAEDGIRDGHVTGVQTCALPISDFDALPIQDQKEVSYKSKVPGVMHACGHDGHTASLLVLAKVVKEFQEDLPGTIIFVHQHAEEIPPGGAQPIRSEEHTSELQSRGH